MNVKKSGILILFLLIVSIMPISAYEIEQLSPGNVSQSMDVGCCDNNDTPYVEIKNNLDFKNIGLNSMGIECGLTHLTSTSELNKTDTEVKGDNEKRGREFQDTDHTGKWTKALYYSLVTLGVLAIFAGLYCGGGFAYAMVYGTQALSGGVKISLVALTIFSGIGGALSSYFR